MFVPGSLLTLALTPKTAVSGKVEARAFLSPSAGNGDLRPWEPEPRFETPAGGSVRLRGTLGQDLQLSPGDWTVWVVVGREGRIPSAGELQAGLRSGRTPQEAWRTVCAGLQAKPIRRRPWQVTCADLRMEGPPHS